MSEEKKSDNKLVKTIVTVVVVISLGGALAPLLLDHFSNDGPLTSDKNIIEETVVKEEPVILEKPAIHPPNKPVLAQRTASISTIIEQAQPTIQLPTLEESDPFILKEINISNEKDLFVPEAIINNMVVFVDNFSRGTVVPKFSPLVKPTEHFSVKDFNGAIIIDTDSYHRYDRYAQAIEAIDVDNFIVFYQQLMPLIDQAYQEIGYPSGAFNSTFEKALDQLLETPIIHYELEVVSPSAMYQYADKSLESLPDTQKLMLRMGPDNLKIVQQKMREIKNELERL